MILKTLIKNPIFIVGILLMTILLLTLDREGKLFSRNNLLKATSCNSVLVMLNNRKPKDWNTSCNDNNLLVSTQFKLPVKFLGDNKKIKHILYRELANSLVFIARNSLNESLERVTFVHVKIDSEKLMIDALTEGKYISKLATITNETFIADHLKNTVKIKESIK